MERIGSNASLARGVKAQRRAASGDGVESVSSPSVRSAPIARLAPQRGI
jgi:hypothetical protein